MNKKKINVLTLFIAFQQVISKYRIVILFIEFQTLAGCFTIIVEANIGL